MLILTRNAGERLIISTPAGEEIAIQVVGCRGMVKLGIEAPKTITVDREEIHRRKIAERQTSAGTLATALIQAVADPRRDPTKRVTRQDARELGTIVAEAILQPQAS